MSMTLGNMTSIATLTQGANAAIAKRGNAAVDPFGAANLRVEQKLSSTDVRLSSFSQMKAGFAGVQAAAKDLSAPKKTGSTADIVKVAQSFATAFNTATSSVNSAVKGDGKKSGVLAGDAHATLASNDLRSIVASGSNTADLRKIGISLKSDGTIAVDSAALQSAIQSNPNAVKDTLSRIGKQAEQVSAKELAATGNVGGSVDTLTNLSKGLTTQLAEQKRLAAASQDALQQQFVSSNAASGIDAYMKIFSL